MRKVSKRVSNKVTTDKKDKPSKASGGHNRPKYDWGAIERDYVRGYDDETGHHYPTQRELSEKYGPSPARIGTKAKKEQWLLRREQFVNKVRARTTDKMVEEISEDSCDFNLKVFQAATTGVLRIQELLDQVADPRAINSLMSALQSAQRTAAATLGDTPDNGHVDIHVSLEDDNQ